MDRLRGFISRFHRTRPPILPALVVILPLVLALPNLAASQVPFTGSVISFVASYGSITTVAYGSFGELYIQPRYDNLRVTLRNVSAGDADLQGRPFTAQITTGVPGLLPVGFNLTFLSTSSPTLTSLLNLTLQLFPSFALPAGSSLLLLRWSPSDSMWLSLPPIDTTGWGNMTGARLRGSRFELNGQGVYAVATAASGAALPVAWGTKIRYNPSTPLTLILPQTTAPPNVTSYTPHSLTISFTSNLSQTITPVSLLDPPPYTNVRLIWGAAVTLATDLQAWDDSARVVVSATVGSSAWVVGLNGAAAQGAVDLGSVTWMSFNVYNAARWDKLDSSVNAPARTVMSANVSYAPVLALGAYDSSSGKPTRTVFF
ncbi:hypothetical protein M427DRAFT_29915 [Gonapodya prolifera JEL478]|uniref:DNRLRE domain-containing protein n=1 Tax=Gonapodya prolifera (strain JEL478) TaxID=1344416 RepID=A0A139ANV4_GONPJ|nr:hypothetical protein M427DRAFT_29915 [Gonapodya prolifera JEL478]|eukprot:KXS18183.1 hypothetical protein M427DRAFT_29915 [Gonapodya prolifera JEL478]